MLHTGFLGSSAGKESTYNAEDPGLTPGSGRSPGEGTGYPFQYSWTSLMAQMAQGLPQCRRPWFDPYVGKTPRRRAWQPTPVSLPGESQWREEPGRLQSMGSQRVRQDWATKHCTEQCYIQSLMSYIYNSIPLLPIRKFYWKGKKWIIIEIIWNIFIAIMGILAASNKKINNSNQFKQKGNILT